MNVSRRFSAIVAARGIRQEAFTGSGPAGIPTLLGLLALALSPIHAWPQQDGDPVTLGSYRVLHSEILNEARTLQVFLPRGYEFSALDYPVVYLFHSDQVEEYFAEALSTLSMLSADLIPQVILVGIANVDRYRDFYPWPRGDGWGGEAGVFLDFVRDELIPFVDREYRTKAYRILVGPQAAGVFGAFTLLEDPDLFQAFILNDPCRLDSDERFLCGELGSFAKSPRARGIFLAVSHRALEDRWEMGRLESLRGVFQEDGVEGFRWRITLDPSWELFLAPLHLRENLLAMFPGYRFPENRDVAELGDVLSHYSALSRRYGFLVDPPALVLAQASDRLTESGRYQPALQVLEHLVALYPESLDGYWRLANLHREAGDTVSAVWYYRECLTREPNMTPARVWLERLGGGGYPTPSP